MGASDNVVACHLGETRMCFLILFGATIGFVVDTRTPWDAPSGASGGAPKDAPKEAPPLSLFRRRWR